MAAECPSRKGPRGPSLPHKITVLRQFLQILEASPGIELGMRILQALIENPEMPINTGVSVHQKTTWNYLLRTICLTKIH